MITSLVQEPLSEIRTDNPPPTLTLSFQPKPEFRHLAGDPQIASCRGKRIGILVVAYNALSTLRSVLQRIPPAVWENAEEIVVFDDASADATFELAVGIKMILASPKLRILRNDKNLGYGGNQKAGYRYFLEKGFDICVLLHGDGQYAPEMLAQMYHPIVEGRAEAVFGSRVMHGIDGALRGGMPLYKYLGNRVLSLYENRALGMNLTEFHSGYRAYDLNALRKIDLRRMTDDFHFDTQIIIKLHHQNCRILEIPIPTYYGSELCYVNGLRYAADVVRSVRKFKRTLSGKDCAPEFAEYHIHYPPKAGRGSSHNVALRSLGPNLRILDIGCGEGFFAAQLAERGHTVTGIDNIENPARRDAMAEYYRIDLDSGELQGVAGTFDCILLLDILEHLKNPDKLLRSVQCLLKPGGRVVLSVPNIANVIIRLQLLFGRFEYAPRGILDSTHLRFFTRRTTRALVNSCGYESSQERVTLIPAELVLGLPPGSHLLNLINGCLSALTRLLPGLFGYQIMHLMTFSDVSE